jgi:small-conductance mechanosensitive channel
MNAALQGLLTGLGIAAAMFAFDYVMIRRGAAERAEKQHKKVVEFDETDRKRIRSLGRFCLVLPFAFAGFFWLVWG